MERFFFMMNFTNYKRGFIFFLLNLLLISCSAFASNHSAATPTPAATSSGGPSIFEGHVVPNQYTSLFFYSTGVVSDVLVKQGDDVKKGDILARLGDREPANAALAAAQLELANAQRQLDDLNTRAALVSAQAQADLTTAQRDYTNATQKLADLDTADYQTRLDNANTDISKAKDDLKTANDDFDKVKNLSTDNTDRKNADTKLKDAQKKYDDLVRVRDLLVNDLDTAQAQAALTKARWDEALNTRDDTKNGPDPKDMALANDRLANANAQLTAAQSSLEHLDLKAPYDCTVVKVDLHPGEQATPGTPVIEVADMSTWYVETSDLTEKDVVAITNGQKATIVPDALPEVTMNGSVESISDFFVEKSGDINYVVRILVEKPDAALRWGMTVNVTFVK
jgi:HlyD family secretion protein